MKEISSDFGHWLAGFADGEGTFTIDRHHGSETGWCYAPRFTLVLRDDDSSILFECKEKTGLGNLRAASHKIGQPQLMWTVNNKSDVMSLVRIFDRYPLRSKKARDFTIWRQAVSLWQDVRTGGRGGWSRRANKELYGQLQQLRDKLMNVRRYGSATIYIPAGQNGIPLVSTVDNNGQR